MKLWILAKLLILRGSGTIMTFSVGIVIARLHGATGFGFYSLFVSLCAGLMILAKFGADNVLVRDISVALSHKNTSVATGAWLFTLLTSLLICTLLLATIFYANKAIIGAIFPQEMVPVVIQHAALTLLPATLLAINIGALRGGGCVASASAIEMLLLPAIILIALTQLSLSPLSSYATAMIISAVISLPVLLISVPLWKRPAAPDIKSLLSSGWYVVGISLIDFITNWSASYTLAIMHSEKDVGIFNACWRLAVALNMAMLVLDQINAPRFASLHSNGDKNELESCVQQTATIGAAIAIITLPTLVIFGPWLLSWFGPDFTTGASALAILAAGQFISLCCGSTGYLLIMTGNGRLLRNINAAVLLLQVISLPWLIKNMGLDGAAIGSAAAIAGNKLLTAFAASRVLAIRVHPSARQLQSLWRQLKTSNIKMGTL